MKQKVVIRVDMSDPKKSRAKAMKIAATFPGVESVAIKGDNKDRLEVIGNEIDTVQLAKSLRKNVGSADLISVGPAKDDKKDDLKKPHFQVYGSNAYPYNYYYGSHVPSYQPVYAVRDSYHDPNCSIM
ncbi:heavy metal-associated isoprenylated plant protein 16-like [Apium graveolens]|uniref:heavy metal-associated isoprenylated plant protein 16-like n=1 Tax=Apium graveolens TaxID=4045 RepID=UPI003D79088B